MYRSPAPGEPPFVREGDKVKKGQAVCIVEAMKLMNEIEVGGGREAGAGAQVRGRAPGCPARGLHRAAAPLHPLGPRAPPRARHAVASTLPPTASCNQLPHRTAPSHPPIPQTEVGGTVVKILVENGSPITPGQPIMLVKPE